MLLVSHHSLAGLTKLRLVSLLMTSNQAVLATYSKKIHYIMYSEVIINYIIVHLVVVVIVLYSMWI